MPQGRAEVVPIRGEGGGGGGGGGEALFAIERIVDLETQAVRAVHRRQRSGKLERSKRSRDGRKAGSGWLKAFSPDLVWRGHKGKVSPDIVDGGE